jgi:hypothetical protein
MCFDSEWKVGKAVDTIARQGKIANENNKVPDDQVSVKVRRTLH